MLFGLFALVGLGQAMLLYLDHGELILYLTAALTALHLAHQHLSTPNRQLTTLLASGEVPYQLAYLLGLKLYMRHTSLMHFVPLILSTTGRLMTMLNERNDNLTAVVEELILFQTKCEAFILGMFVLEALGLDLEVWAGLVVYALWVKAKYSMYFGSQKAFVELHFSFDHLSKRWGMRSCYHLVYKVVSNFSGVYSGNREIVY